MQASAVDYLHKNDFGLLCYQAIDWGRELILELMYVGDHS
jgi:hypothetical protein